MEGFVERFVALPDAYDLRGTLRVLQHGGYDPTTRVTASVAWRAVRTDGGTATVRYERCSGGVTVTAWGDGAPRALDDAPAVLGAADDPSAFLPSGGPLRDLARRFPGIHLPATRSIFEPLIPAILEQKVTSIEAYRSYAGLVRAYGEPAPGPAGLLVAPAPATLAALAYHAFHRFGIEQRRADVIRRVCARETRMNEAIAMPAAEARTRLCAIPGIGPWTAAEVTRVSHGDPDAVSVGDYHIPNMVAWFLAGEARADDARMLELLEPYAGQRGRAIRLIEASGIGPPKFGPRNRLRQIARQ